jgi:tetratricopeptide (TPR) repeat protein
LRNQIFVTVCCVGLISCGGKHPGSYEKLAASNTASGADSATSEADAAWDGRVSEQELQKSLEKYEAVVSSDPKNRVALERLTRGYYFWGDAFTEEKETKLARWEKAIEWGTACLALNEDFAKRVTVDKQKERDAVDAIAADDVPCMYWTASALGKWGKLSGLSKTLKHLPTVKAYIATVERLDPTFNNYGPARYWGAYYSVIPSFAGQDLEKSAQYFTASIDGAPSYLGTRVLRAEHLAVKLGDVSLFDEDLKFVLDADPELDGFTAENKLEKEKAKKLIEKRYELFDKKALQAVDGE